MTHSRLQNELRKKKPFDSVEQEATLALIRTSDQLSIRFARLFRVHNLTSSQYNILRILRGEGDRLPILEIAQRTITVVPGITGLVDRLEQAGLVIRERCEKDRRVIYVALTKDGRHTVEKLDQPVLEMHRALMSNLSKPDLKELTRLLEKIREGIAVDEQSS